MDKQEFFAWMKADFKNFSIFINYVVHEATVFNQCRLCGYRTTKAKLYNSDDIEHIDNSAINHLLTEKHIGDVPKIYNEERSKQIALKKGQTTLEI